MKHCANCFDWAHEWHRTRIVERAPVQSQQMELAL